MALGTPVAGTIAYSAADASLSVSYPSGITANHALVLIVAVKGTTATSSSVVVPSGWTTQIQRSAGNFVGAPASDTGNTNLYIMTKDTVTGSESGSVALTLITSPSVAWAQIIRVPKAAGKDVEFEANGYADNITGTDVVAALPVSSGAVPEFTAGDLAIYAMSQPVAGVTFSAETISATGATFAASTELNEPSTTNGLHIGGFVAYASVSSGTSTSQVSITATASAGTNLKGPILLLRLREVTPAVTRRNVTVNWW